MPHTTEELHLLYEDSFCLLGLWKDGAYRQFYRYPCTLFFLERSQWKACVTNINPALKAAFVDLQLQTENGLRLPLAFLPLPKDTVLHEGQHIEVQVLSLPRENKGPKLKLLSPSPSSEQSGVPLCLKEGPSPLDVLASTTSLLRLGDPAKAPALRKRYPFLDIQVSLVKEDWMYDLKALAEETTLKSVQISEKTNLLIEPTTTLTAIDVNGQNALESNQEAAPVIGREILLRNISGLIVIDFLDIEEKKQRRALTTLLEEALSEDPYHHEILPMNHLGVVIMTRQRRFHALCHSPLFKKPELTTEEPDDTPL